jgi:hypothetical protein
MNANSPLSPHSKPCFADLDHFADHGHWVNFIAAGAGVTLNILYRNDAAGCLGRQLCQQLQ